MAGGRARDGALIAAGSFSRDAIDATHRLIAGHIRRTPVIVVRGDELGLAPDPLTLKLELFQHTGSFKPRGAFANLLLRKAPAAGVVAASGGNHGAAVAYAAMKLGFPAKIFVPAVASPAWIPRRSVRSTTRTLRPSIAANSAADMPATPAPITTRS